jgi:recombinational DNA repair protein (RecF pathway)
LPGTFQLLAGQLDHLPVQPLQPLTVFAFEMKLLAELGLRPDFEKSKLSGGARRILESAIVTDWKRLSRLKLSKTQSEEIRQFLHGFLIYHLGRIPDRRNAVL